MIGIGVEAPKDTEARELHQMINDDGRNSRQIIAELMADKPKMEWPVPPTNIDGIAPPQINIYSDGAVKCPAIRGFSHGGFGIWIPGENDQILGDNEKWQGTWSVAHGKTV